MKKILLSLFVGLIGIISFCSANGYYDLIDFTCDSSSCIITTSGVNYDLVSYYSYFYCGPNSYYVSKQSWNATENILVNINTNNSDCSLSSTPTWNAFRFKNSSNIYSRYLSYYNSSCSELKISLLKTEGGGPFDYTLFCERVNQSPVKPYCETCQECPTCEEQYTSLDCQTEYNLIPVESVDINYCVGNGLCPNECGSGSDLSGDLQYSNLYINSILHPGTQNIFVDIPDYITWDYTTTGDDFNIYVGSGYDMDYMNSIIKINSYRPDSRDFTDIFVSGLTLIFPYIFIVLLILFIWKLLKRIFK